MKPLKSIKDSTKTRVSGLVERWVSCLKFRITPNEVIYFFGNMAAIEQAATTEQMEKIMFGDELPKCKREAIMLFYSSKYEFIDSLKPSNTVGIKQKQQDENQDRNKK